MIKIRFSFIIASHSFIGIDVGSDTGFLGLGFEFVFYTDRSQIGYDLLIQEPTRLPFPVTVTLVSEKARCGFYKQTV
jgi:hypothetical protein